MTPKRQDQKQDGECAFERQIAFYLSFEKGIQKLNDDEQLLVYRAISRYFLFGELPELTGFAAMVWELIYPALNK